MLEENIVLSAQNICKKYVIHNNDSSVKGESDFWALRNINFELRKGEILGIIGQNGAGKSTLLKILSEVIAPTDGIVEYKGSMLSILEIGTGFHADLTGYDNIFLNASLLGMKKKEISARLDEIIDFSGIREFIHEPIKNYSSGMYLRLALSIALFTSNEIILLDEVVSVGDAEFRLKAIHKIREQAGEGRACIMISHDLNSILQLCDSCMLLEKGSIIYNGKANQAVQDYYDTIYKRVQPKVDIKENEICHLISVHTDREIYYTDEEVKIAVSYQVKQREDVRVIVKISFFQNALLTDSHVYRPDFEPVFLEPGKYQTECVIPANLLNRGNYVISILLTNASTIFAERESIHKFSMKHREWEADKIWNSNNITFPLRPRCRWITEKKDV